MIDFLTHVAADGERLRAAAVAAGLDAAVPSCPGWAVRDLVAHTGQVHREKEQIVRERRSDPPPEVVPPDDGLLDWYGEGLDQLVATLTAADPATAVWTWHEPDHSVGFWRRRMAHETLVHRVDAEQAAGLPSAVDADLAADGIDEILIVMMSTAPSWASVALGEGSIRLVVPGREWTMRRAYLSGTSPHTGNIYEDLEMAAYDAGGTKPDCVVQGGAADMDLWLWGRAPLAALAVDGDADLASWLRARAAEDTQ